MKIITVLFNQFRNGEFLQFTKNSSAIIDSYDLEALKLAGTKSKLDSQIESLDTVFKPISGAELTSELQELDIRRDKALMGIKNMLQSCQYREEEEVVEAAGLLLDSYNSFDQRIDKLPYQQQTAITHAFIKEVKEKEKLSSTLETASIAQWFTLLEELNNSFDETYVERSKASLPPANIQEKREAIQELYTSLTADIEAYARVAENKEAYLPLIEDLNALIDDYNQAALNRLSGRSSSDDITTQLQN